MTAALPSGVEVIDDPDRLAAIEGEWWDLFARAPAATVFQSPAFLIPWWPAFAPGPLATIAVRRAGRLVALAPSWIERDGPLGRRLLPLGISLADHLDVLVDPAAGPEAVEALVAAAARLDWDRWDLEDLDGAAAAPRLPVPAGCEDLSEETVTCPVLSLEAGFPACLPSRKRRQVRRAREKAEARGGVLVERCEEDPDRFFAELERLHRMRWSGRGEEGVLADPRAARFHLEALHRLAAAGMARSLVVRIGGTVAAAYHGMAHGGAALAYMGGFDPGFSEESPGSIAMAEAIALAAAEGRTEYRFLRGAEDYKYRWGGTDRFSRRRSFRRGSGR